MSKENLSPRSLDFVESVKNPAEDRGKQVWDGYIGGVMVRNKNLFLLVKILAFVCIVLAGALVYKSLAISTVPYFIEVDKVNGDIRVVGDIRENKYVADKGVLKAQIRKFIIDTRGVTSDPNVFKERLEEAYNMLSQNGQKKLQNYFESTKRNDLFGRMTVQIQISSILEKGDNAYQVSWIENATEGNGRKQSVYMTGIFTIKELPVEDENLKRANPLGLFITDFSWDQDDTATAAAKNTNNNGGL